MTEGRVSRKRILIAEDDPVSRRMLQAFLSKWNYKVETAADGLRGAILQVPPMHSALKRDGRPLYEYARKGIELDRQER